MSRSGYSDDLDNWALIKWRGAVTSAMRGRRGQAFLKELLAALDALPEKRLIAEELEVPAGGMPFHLRTDVCALGSVGRARGMDMTKLDACDHETVAARFGIPHALACEIMFTNDEYRRETPEARFARVRRWVASLIK
jgi:hypothetical protein